MSIVVQKFGGTSVGDPDRIRRAAKRALDAQAAGCQVVVVVSAMGDTTDDLITLADRITQNPPAREMDLLLSTGEQISVALMSMAIHEQGGKAWGMTGFQIGVETDSRHTKARIRSISTDRMKKKLDEGYIIVAAGFQGVDQDGNITTLGRGGSDTSAVALAAVLKASQCIIHTDVDGVYTTDPRIVPSAQHLGEISFEEMLELAAVGAGVMHGRSIEIAKRFDIPVYVRNSFSENPGTWICTDQQTQRWPVCGAALLQNEARVSVTGVPDRPGAAQTIFSGIARRNVAVDMIVQNAGREGHADISFTVPKGELADTLAAAKTAAQELGATGVDFEAEVAKVSIVGRGMADTPGVAAKMFQALADRGINILMITTSEIKVSALVAKADGRAALEAVHAAFELDRMGERQTREHLGRFDAQAGHRAMSADEVVQHLQADAGERSATRRVEQVSIDSIAVNTQQSLVTVGPVPDQPGIAAKLFQWIGQAGLNIDMIVQDASSQGQNAISFTLSRSELDRCVSVLNKLAETFPIGPVRTRRDIAKVTVAGVGLRSHTDVADRLFQALARNSVNVCLINTSEVLINVIVSESDAAPARSAIEQEFDDVLLKD